MSDTPAHALTAIIPCNDLDVSEAFYNRLGFFQAAGEENRYEDYRMLSDERGAAVHLTKAVPGWVVPGQNPFGVYFYSAEVEALGARVKDDIIEKEKSPTHKPWGMYEFALSDPDGVLVRVGWPSRLLSGHPESGH